MSKGLIVLLWMLVAFSTSTPRYKRTLGWILSPEQPSEKKYPIYKVHRYSGVHLYPIVPGSDGSVLGDSNSGSPPDLVQIRDEDSDSNFEDEPSALSSLGSLASLGTSLLPLGSGVLGVSNGGERAAEERIGLASKKHILLRLNEKKKNAVISLKSGIVSGASTVFNKAVSTGQTAAKSVSNILIGQGVSEPITTGLFREVPILYPKKPGLLSKIPIVGRLFASGYPIELPEVRFPDLPHLVRVDTPPNLPYITLPANYEFPHKTGSYVKIKVPKVGKYEIPHTSYGTPALAVPAPDKDAEYSDASMPQADDSENEIKDVVSSESPALPSAPEYVPPPVVPTKPAQQPYPAEVPKPASPLPLGPYPGEVPTGPYPAEVPTGPYPPESPSPSYPYPPSGYYETAGSHLEEVRVRPVYRVQEIAREGEDVDVVTNQPQPKATVVEEHTTEAPSTEVNSS